MDEVINNQTNQLEPTPPSGFFARNKKLILIVLALLLVVESVWAISFIRSSKRKAAQPEKPKVKIASLSLEPNLIEAIVGQEFTVEVVVDTASREVNGVDAVILFDPQFLDVVDSDNQTPATQVAPGNLFNTLLVNNIDPASGKIVLTGSRLSKNSQAPSGKGTLASISFIAKKSGQTELTIVFDPSKTNTSNVTEAKTSNNILTTVSDARVKISQ